MGRVWTLVGSVADDVNTLAGSRWIDSRCCFPWLLACLCSPGRDMAHYAGLGSSQLVVISGGSCQQPLINYPIHRRNARLVARPPPLHSDAPSHSDKTGPQPGPRHLKRLLGTQHTNIGSSRLIQLRLPASSSKIISFVFPALCGYLLIPPRNHHPLILPLSSAAAHHSAPWAAPSPGA